MKHFLLALLSLIAAVCAASGQADSIKTLKGRVIYDNGTPLSNCLIYIFEKDVFVKNIYTDDSGRFSFTSRADRPKIRVVSYEIDDYNDFTFNESDSVTIIIGIISGDLHFKQAVSKTFIDKNPWTLAMNSETGVGTLTDDTPTHTSNQISPSNVRSIKYRNGTAHIKQRERQVIRLKSRGIELNFESSTGVDFVASLPRLQSRYAQGRSSGGSPHWFGPETNEILAWGSDLRSLEYDGSQYDFDLNGRLTSTGNGNGKAANIYGNKGFFRTGFFTGNKLTFYQHGMAGGYLQADLGQSHRTGAMRGSSSDLYNLSFAFKNITPAKGLTTDFTVTYKQSEENLSTRGANTASIIGALLTTPPSFDNTNSLKPREAVGNKLAWQTESGRIRSYAPGYSDNPYALLNELPDKENGQHILGSARIKYALERFNISLNANAQRVADESVCGIPPGFATFTPGRMSVRKTETNSALIELSPEYEFRRMRDHSFKIHAIYRLNYHITELEKKNGSNFASGFGDVDKATRIERLTHNGSRTANELKYGFDYTYNGKASLFAQFAGRHHFSNTIAGVSRLFPHAGLRIDIAQPLSDAPWFSHLSLFAEASESMREAPLIYNNRSVLSTSMSAVNYNKFFEADEIYPAPGLKPEISRNLSTGISINVFDYSLIFDVRYFNITTDNFVVPVREAGGFALANAAKVNNAGCNITLSFNKYGKYYRYPNEVDYGLRLTWSRYANIVKNNYMENLLPLAGFDDIMTVLAEGQALGTIYGTGKLRDAEGRTIIDDEGFPIKDNELRPIGDPTPDWTASIAPWVSYENFLLAVVVELRKGGAVWNGTQAALDYHGMSELTGKERNTKGYIFNGINSSGEINTKAVDFYDHTLPVERNRWVRYGYSGIAEDYIQDASWIRLAEVSLSYRIELQAGVFKELSLALAGRNLLLITGYEGVDPAFSLFNYASGRGLDLFNNPSVRSLLFTLRLKLRN